MSQKKDGLGKILLGIVGIGASIFAAKKIVDLYASSEEDTMSELDYMTEIKNKKNEYGLSGNDEFFDYDLITGNANADELFKKLLKSVNKMWEIPSKVLKIGDIEKLVAFEDSGIESKSNYGYAIMSMLSNQGNRDYVTFLGNSNLPNLFKEEANKGDRNNFYWKNFSEARFIINPKYIRENFKQ